MLCVEVQFQIETLYSDGLNHTELLDLWGYLKSRVYMNRPRTIEELKLAIRQEITAPPQKMLERVMQDFEERLQMCVWQGHNLTLFSVRNLVCSLKMHENTFFLV